MISTTLGPIPNPTIALNQQPTYTILITSTCLPFPKRPLPKTNVPSIPTSFPNQPILVFTSPTFPESTIVASLLIRWSLRTTTFFKGGVMITAHLPYPKTTPLSPMVGPNASLNLLTSTMTTIGSNFTLLIK